MAEAWYPPEELQEQADGAQTQPEFTREIEEDPEDLSWEAVQALFDRHGEIQDIIDTITQSYPTVSSDVDVSL